MEATSRALCCEKIYRWMKDGSTEREIANIAELSKALHLIGKNPSQRSLEICWKKHGGKLSFGEFLRLADENDSELKMADLLDAFAIVAKNSTGVVAKNMLMELLTSKGECMMQDEVENLLSEHHDEVDYLKLCRSILDLNSRLWLPADKVDCSMGNFNTKTFTRKKGSNYENISPPPCTPVNVQNEMVNGVSVQGWNISSMQGCFYMGVDGKIQSPQYIMSLSEETAVWICIQADRESDVDTEVLLFAEEGSGRSLVGYTQVKDAKGRYCLRSTLKSGQYLVVPFTTGCHMQFLTDSELSVTQDRSTLVGALRLAFNCLDQDGDHLLNYKEFGAFQLQSAGRNILQEEWQHLMQNSLNDCGITEEEFIGMHLQQGSAVVVQILNRLGFGDAFKICPFTVAVHCETGKPTVRTLPVTDGSSLIERTLSRIVAGQGSKTHINNFKDLTLHILKLPHRISIAVHNKSHSALSIHLDCRESENCLSHRGKLDYVVKVPPRICMIAHHLIQNQRNLLWVAKWQETLIK